MLGSSSACSRPAGDARARARNVRQKHLALLSRPGGDRPRARPPLGDSTTPRPRRSGRVPTRRARSSAIPRTARRGSGSTARSSASASHDRARGGVDQRRPTPTGPSPVRVAALLRAADIAERHLKRRDEALAHLRAAWAIDPGNSAVFDALSALLSPPALDLDEGSARRARAHRLYTQAANATEDPSARDRAAREARRRSGRTSSASPRARSRRSSRSSPSSRSAARRSSRSSATPQRAGDAKQLARALCAEAELTTSARSSAALAPRRRGDGGARRRSRPGARARRPRARDRAAHPDALRARYRLMEQGEPLRARRGERCSRSSGRDPDDDRRFSPLDRGRAARRAPPQAAAQRRRGVPRRRRLMKPRSPAAAIARSRGSSANREPREARRGAHPARGDRRGPDEYARLSSRRPRCRSSSWRDEDALRLLPAPTRRSPRASGSGDARGDGAHLRPRPAAQASASASACPSRSGPRPASACQPAGCPPHDRERARGALRALARAQAAGARDHNAPHRPRAGPRGEQPAPTPSSSSRAPRRGAEPRPGAPHARAALPAARAPTPLATVLRAEADVFASLRALRRALGARRPRGAARPGAALEALARIVKEAPDDAAARPGDAPHRGRAREPRQRAAPRRARDPRAPSPAISRRADARSRSRAPSTASRRRSSRRRRPTRTPPPPAPRSPASARARAVAREPPRGARARVGSRAPRRPREP